MQPHRPLRFLHLSTFYPPYSFGGDAVYLHRLAHALGDRGHEVDVVHCRDAYHLLHPGAPEVRFVEHPRVTRHELRTGWGSLSPLLTQQSGRAGLKAGALRSILARKRYDVVHFHNVSLLGLDVLAHAGADRDAVVLYTAHEYWLVCPTHMLWKLGRRACEKPECIRCQLVARRPPQLWRFGRGLERFADRVDLFLAPSRFAAAMHAARGFARPMAELPYFADDAAADRRTSGARPHDRPYFLFVGRLEPQKGVHTLIDAWEKAGDADLLIAGTGTEEGALRRRAAADPRVRFLGALAQSELGPLYAHALACIVPSLAYETFAMVIIEAFSRATPVIVRDIGPPPEIARESGGGLVYRDEAELLDAVERIGSQPELRAALGESGHRAFRRRWTPGAHLDAYLDHVRTAALGKFGRVPWEPEATVSVASAERVARNWTAGSE